jgi:hypothetical protein
MSRNKFVGWCAADKRALRTPSQEDYVPDPTLVRVHRFGGYVPQRLE